MAPPPSCTSGMSNAGPPFTADTGAPTVTETATAWLTPVPEIWIEPLLVPAAVNAVVVTEKVKVAGLPALTVRLGEERLIQDGPAFKVRTTGVVEVVLTCTETAAGAGAPMVQEMGTDDCERVMAGGTG